MPLDMPNLTYADSSQLKDTFCRGLSPIFYYTRQRFSLPGEQEATQGGATPWRHESYIRKFVQALAAQT